MAVALPSATLIPSPAARAGSRENDNEGTGLPAGGTSPEHRPRPERCPPDLGGAAGPARDPGRDRSGVARLEPARVGTTRRERAQPTAASGRDGAAAGARLRPVTAADTWHLVIDLHTLWSLGRTTIGGVGNRSSPIIVGRDVELARIEHGLEVAALGRPALLLVRGEAGIGKSRLVRQAVQPPRGCGAARFPRARAGLSGGGTPHPPLCGDSAGPSPRNAPLPL